MSGAPPPGSPRARLDRLFRTSLWIVPVGVLGNIAFSFWATDRSVLASLGEFPLRYLALALLLALVPWLTNSLRLYIWIRFLGYPVSLRHTFRMVLGTDLGSAVSPTAVGGSFIKFGMLVQRGVRPGAAASVMSVGALENGLFFLVAIPAAIVFSSAWRLPIFQQIGAELRDNLTEAGLVAAAVVLLSWLTLRLALGGRLGARIRRWTLRGIALGRRRTRGAWRDAVEVYRLIHGRGKSRFALTLSLTAVQWAARYSVISALVAFLGAPVRPVLFWLFQWVVFTLMTLIPTPGAAVGAEATFYFIYAGLLPEEVIGIATAGWRFLTFYFQLGLAAILFFLLNLGGGRGKLAAGNPS